MRWPHSTLKFLSWSEVFNVGFTVTAPSVRTPICPMLACWVHNICQTGPDHRLALRNCVHTAQTNGLTAAGASSVRRLCCPQSDALAAQCYIQHFGFYQLYVVTLALPMALLGLCVALNRAAASLHRCTAHPRDGGLLLPWLPQKHRTWWHDWSSNLRTRRAFSAPELVFDTFITPCGGRVFNHSLVARCRCWKNAFWLVTLLYPRCSMTALEMFSYTDLDIGRCARCDLSLLPLCASSS